MVPSRRPLRIALALVFFISLTTAGLALLTARKNPRRLSRSAARATELPSAAEDGGFFYKSLGRSPVEADQRDGGDAIKVANVSGYTVEFSAPTHQQEAEQLVDSLGAKGITAYYTPLSDNGRIFYRVRKGLYADEAQALLEAKTLAKLVGREPRVVKLE